MCGSVQRNRLPTGSAGWTAGKDNSLPFMNEEQKIGFVGDRIILLSISSLLAMRLALRL